MVRYDGKIHGVKQHKKGGWELDGGGGLWDTSQLE